jgi:uncharacterized membrane protein YesL
MAKNKKGGGFISRLMLGSEKSEGYARASLPSNRWELFWDIFKGRFGKLVIINLLTLLFCIPFLALLFFRYIALTNYGVIYPFSQGFGAGYGALPPNLIVGLPENIVFNVNMIIFLFAPLAFMFAAVGISGGAYVIRNMVWTEGIFVANDFWRGIKQNFKQMLWIFLVYSLVFYFSTISIAMCDQTIAMGTNMKWLFIISEVLTYGLLAVFTIMTLHMITMSVTYNLKFRHLIKNSFLFTIGLLPQNLFFIACGLIPFIVLLFGNFFLTIGIILILLFVLSMFLLIWTNFCQWAYDRFVNDKIPGAQKNRGIYEKIKESDSSALKQYREQMAMASRSSLNSKPIKPITDDELKLHELPTSFNRSDIEKLNESKQAIYEDHERYVEEHKNDPEFQPTEAEKELEKEKEEREKRIEKAKKELAKRNKKK